MYTTRNNQRDSTTHPQPSGDPAFIASTSDEGPISDMAQDHEFESFMSDPNGLDDRVFAPGGWAGTQDASILPPEAMGLDLEYIQVRCIRATV